MRARVSLFVALPTLAFVILGAALVRRGRASEPPSVDDLGALLAQPLDAVPGPAGEGAPRVFWEALLAPPFAARTDAGVTLRLGRVQADPTAAQGSAESAGALLELEAEGPEGKLGVPLWRAVLDGPALVSDATGRRLALYGCRHSADADAAPSIEDSYRARLALARALGELAGTERGAPPLALAGTDAPVRGGVNFEVQLVGETQSVLVTFDGRPGPYLRAARAYRPSAPNDARTRAALVAALRALASSAPGAAPLAIEGEDAPVPGGVDVRIERFGDRLAAVAHLGVGQRLATHLKPSGSAAGAQD